MSSADDAGRGRTCELSVVVPAHNEEGVIGRCLDALLAGPLSLEVVVAANGCSDRTTSIASRYPVAVVETDVANKAAALNLGDSSARSMPRLYLDADIVIAGHELPHLLRTLDAPEPRVVVPRLQVDLSGTSRGVRWFYDVWLQLPYARQNLGGTGAYALNDGGRRRFDQFPPLIADDAFVYSLFAPEERVVATDVRSMVTPPRTLKHLVNVRARITIGNQDLRRSSTAPAAVEPDANVRRELLRLARRPRFWGRVPFYLAVVAAIRLVANGRRRRGSHQTWARDESSRTGTPPTTK